MAAPLRKLVETELQPAPQKSAGAPRLATGQDAAAPSPALDQQKMLQDQWVDQWNVSEPSRKWPIRRTVALVTLSCGGFWIGVAWGLTRLIR